MRRFVLALVLVALSVVLVTPAAEAGLRGPERHRFGYRTCNVIDRMEPVYATDPARVDSTIRSHVRRSYLADDLTRYWSEAQTCADANLLPIVQGWILYYDPSFVF